MFNKIRDSLKALLPGQTKVEPVDAASSESAEPEAPREVKYFRLGERLIKDEPLPAGGRRFWVFDDLETGQLLRGDWVFHEIQQPDGAQAEELSEGVFGEQVAEQRARRAEHRRLADGLQRKFYSVYGAPVMLVSASDGRTRAYSYRRGGEDLVEDPRALNLILRLNGAGVQSVSATAYLNAINEGRAVLLERLPEWPDQAEG